MQSILEAYEVKTPTTVIPTGIELEQFSQGDGGRFRRRHGIPADRPVLIHIGHLAFEKNVDFFLRVLVRVRREIPHVLTRRCRRGAGTSQLGNHGRGTGPA